MVYTCLYAMRTGLLTRFWGSLGMALGAVSFIFFQFALLWFVYLGLLLLGRVPGGQPPAWERAKPSPGRRRGRKRRPTWKAARGARRAGGRSRAPEPTADARASRRRKRKQRD